MLAQVDDTDPCEKKKLETRWKDKSEPLKLSDERPAFGVAS